MSYTVNNGEEEWESKVEMEPCTDYSVFKSHHSPSKDVIMQRHIDAKQFFCPVDEDLMLYGQRENLHSKILTLEVASCDPTKLSEGQICKDDDSDYLSGKDILLLMNNGFISHDSDFENPNVTNHTEMF